MKRKNLFIYLLSFLLPFGVMLLLLAAWKANPFGKNALLYSDAGAQYYPFFLLLRRILRRGGSLLYSWAAGLGTNLPALLAYYCINPWNLIGLVIPESLLLNYFSISVCIRIGLAGLFFCLMLRTVQQKQESLRIGALICSVLYALNAWLICNHFQLIWLDTVILTPLVLAGLLRLIRDKKPALYIAMLCLSLLCNPYMSYITCLMAVLCWFGIVFVLRESLRDTVRDGLRFAGSSVLAAGLAAVTLIPTAYALFATGTPEAAAFIEPHPLTEAIGRLGSFTTMKMHLGLQNCSAGMLSVMLFAGFFTAKRIPLREKIAVGVLWAFLLVSFWFTPLNTLWHGMHIPHGFIQRFAHLMPLVMCYAGWRFLETWEPAAGRARLRQTLRLLVMLGAGLGVWGLELYHHSTDVPMLPLAVTVLLFFCMLGMIWRESLAPLMLGAMLLLSLGEQGFSSMLSCQGRTFDSKYDELLPRSDLTEAVEAVHLDAKAEERRIYRTAFTQGINYNTELFYDIPFSGELYSSLISADLCSFLQQLGMDSEYGVNYYHYQEMMPFAMMMTGIQYVIAPDGLQLPETDYRQLDGTAAYAFRYPSMIGFCIPVQTAYALPEYQDDASAQESAFRTVCGVTDGPFADLQPDRIETDEDITLTESDGETKFRTAADRSGTTDYSYTADADGWYQFELTAERGAAGALAGYLVTVDDEEVLSGNFTMMKSWKDSGKLLTLGQLTAGQTVKATMIWNKDTEGAYTCRVLRQDPDAFSQVYQQFSAEQLHLTKQRDNVLSGTVTAAEDRMLYLSVPYDKGWTAAVDGVKTETVPLYGAMTGIPLSAGTHTVRLRFMPVGLIAGGAGSAVSLAVYLLLCIASGRKLRRSRNEQRSEE